MKTNSLIVLTVLLLSLISTTSVKAERPLIAKVIKVIDGDTIKIETNIRLAEIDCPESKQTDGNLATDYLKEVVEGKRVTIILGKRGAYGRFIGTLVDASGGNINHELVGEGLCWVYRGSKNSELRGLQEKAKKEKIGIWAGNPVDPYDWRKNRRKKK